MSKLRQWVKSAFRTFGLEVRLASRKHRYHLDGYADLEALFKLVRETPSLILDVGANEGQSTARFLARFPAAAIHAFEPGVEPASKLTTRYADNPSVHLAPMAISNIAGAVDFFANPNSYISSLLPASSPLDSSERKQVQATTLDDYCQEHDIPRVSILKMDIQGGELLALDGARRLLAERRIDLIYSEVLFSDFYRGQAYFHQVAERLLTDDYRLFGLYDFGFTGATLRWCDAIFTAPRFREPALWADF